MSIPTGTVTLLFSDIVGSTFMWEHAPQAMELALRRHNTLVRQAVKGAGGYVFKTVGDEFCVAFATGPAAAKAALVAQGTLLAEVWSQDAQIKVRMALHTGACRERNGDYFGPAVNRTARLMDIAYGGQVVVSGATAGLLGDLPSDVGTLRDLGLHRLRDLERPEHVFQLSSPTNQHVFPQLRSLDNPDLPNNLPALLSNFVGRISELEDVRALVGDFRLVTLTGAGGSGKTRLAMQAAAEMLGGGGDGVWITDLAPVTDEEEVPQAIASALGIHQIANLSSLDALVETLNAQDVLLILDNCEHVISMCAKFADAVVRGCPSVRILATSREPLGVDGEHVFRVPSMSLPDMDVDTLEELTHSDAVSLFLARARDVGFEAVDSDAMTIAAICRRLDGIPLALELAAARLSAMSPTQLHDRLDQRFRLLTGSSRNAMARQQTLQAMVDWSFGLLTPREQSVLCRLTVFSGGFELEAAESVCSSEGVDDLDVANLLRSLVDKSLVVAERDSGSIRFRLLETVRQFGAQELLRVDGERGVLQLRDRHAAFFCSLVGAAGRQLPGPEEGSTMRRLDLELDNLLSMMSHLKASPSGSHELLKVVTSGEYYIATRCRGEFLPFLFHAIDTAGDEGTPELARAQIFSGSIRFVFDASQHAPALIVHENLIRALRLACQLGRPDLEARALVQLAADAFISGEEQGSPDSTLALARERADASGDLSTRYHLRLWSGAFNIPSAPPSEFAFRETMLLEAVDLADEVNSSGLKAHSRDALSWIYLVSGRYEEAEATCRESIHLWEEVGEEIALINPRANLALLIRRRGEVEEAETLVRGSLLTLRRTGVHRSIADELLVSALVAASRGDGARGARLLGAFDSAWDGLMMSGHRKVNLDLKDETWARERLGELLGDDAFHKELELGARLSRKQAIDLALVRNSAMIAK